jgi:hypothetical protein
MGTKTRAEKMAAKLNNKAAVSAIQELTKAVVVLGAAPAMQPVDQVALAESLGAESYLELVKMQLEAQQHGYDQFAAGIATVYSDWSEMAKPRLTENWDAMAVRMAESHPIEMERQKLELKRNEQRFENEKVEAAQRMADREKTAGYAARKAEREEELHKARMADFEEDSDNGVHGHDSWKTAGDIDDPVPEPLPEA